MDPLKRAVQFYRSNFPVLFVVTVAYTTPVFIFMHTYARHLWLKKTLVGQDLMFFSLGILVLLSFMQAGVVYFFYQRMLKPKVSIANSVFAGLIYIHKILFANLLRVMIINIVLFMVAVLIRSIGMAPMSLPVATFLGLLFILFMLFVVIRTAFIELLVLVEQKVVLVSMKESFVMTEKLWGRLMSVLAPLLMLVLAVSLMGARWMKNPLGTILLELVLVSALVSFMTVVFLSFYRQIRHPEPQQ